MPPTVRPSPPRARCGVLPGGRAPSSARRARRGRCPSTGRRTTSAFNRCPVWRCSSSLAVRTTRRPRRFVGSSPRPTAPWTARRCWRRPWTSSWSGGDVAGARASADELSQIASGSASEVLRAMAAQAVGSVLLVEGDPTAALPQLRAASTAWQQMQMPYERARTGVLLGLACAALGDRTSVDLELGSALETFAELGAQPDLHRVEALARQPGGLGRVLRRERGALSAHRPRARGAGPRGCRRDQSGHRRRSGDQ